MERKSSKEYSVVFWWKAKNSSYEICRSRTSSLLYSAANAVGTSPEFAAFGSDPDVKYSRAHLLVFSVHNHGFCGGQSTFSQEKHQGVDVDRDFATEKK